MAFPTTGVLDSFGDTEGPPMTGWATPTGVAGLKSASGVCLANAANAFGVWNSVLSIADAECFVTVSTAAGAGATIAVFARTKDIGSAATFDGYGVVVTEAATDSWTINSYTNGVPTGLGAAFTQEVSNGDSIGISVIGTTIRAWYKASGGSWTELASRTDSTYTAAGYIGLSISDTTGRCDDFGGGSVIISGQANVTLAALTGTATGTIAIAGQSNSTLGALTGAATGTLAIAGQASATLANITLTATGALAIAGQASITLGELTGAATGSLTIAGAGSATLENLTGLATGTIAIAGQANTTLAALTSAATGTLTIVGQGSATLDSLTAAGTGTLAIVGQADVTLGQLTGEATGVLTSGNTGQANVTLDSLTGAATGVLSIAGAANVVLSELTATATGALAIVGQANVVLAELMATAIGALAIAGQASITLEQLTGEATGLSQVSVRDYQIVVAPRARACGGAYNQLDANETDRAEGQATRRVRPKAVRRVR